MSHVLEEIQAHELEFHALLVSTRDTAKERGQSDGFHGKEPQPPTTARERPYYEKGYAQGVEFAAEWATQRQLKTIVKSPIWIPQHRRAMRKRLMKDAVS